MPQLVPFYFINQNTFSEFFRRKNKKILIAMLYIFSINILSNFTFFFLEDSASILLMSTLTSTFLVFFVSPDQYKNVLKKWDNLITQLMPIFGNKYVQQYIKFRCLIKG